jgi:hypothetical protein
MSWEKGRDTIEELLHRRHLEQFPANEAEAQHLMAKARAHLRTAAAVATDDPEIAYDALYAACCARSDDSSDGGVTATTPAPRTRYTPMTSMPTSPPQPPAIVEASSRILPQPTVFVPRR